MENNMNSNEDISYIKYIYNTDGCEIMNPILELDHINYSYHTLGGETKALSNISFSLDPGEFAAVVGPLRMRKIHPALPDRWTYAAGEWAYVP